MTFVADPVALRTYDSDRGLELFTDGGGSDGVTFYVIRRSDGAEVRFSSRYDGRFAEEWIASHPDTVGPMFYIVSPIRGCFPNLSREDSDNIIREALEAFKFIHGKPLMSGVEVFFRTSGGEIRR